MKTIKSRLDFKRWSALLGAAAILGVAGCTDTNNNGQPDSAATPGQVDNAMDNTGDKVEGAADNTADAAGNVVEGAADATTQAGITGKIKSALLADASVGATEIDVDTNEDAKTVALRGEVTNEAQKKLAENIAKQNAPDDYKIANELTVKGGASPMMNKDTP